jgi:hypothetical protein
VRNHERIADAVVVAAGVQLVHLPRHRRRRAEERVGALRVRDVDGRRVGAGGEALEQRVVLEADVVAVRAGAGDGEVEAAVLRAGGEPDSFE